MNESKPALVNSVRICMFVFLCVFAKNNISTITSDKELAQKEGGMIASLAVL